MRTARRLPAGLGAFWLAGKGEELRSVPFREEARGERLANLIRVVYLMTWLTASGVYAAGNFPEFNRINFGIGGFWLAAALAYQVFLSRGAYVPAFKYCSTAFDIAASTGILGSYALAAGPAFALKMPVFLNYFCCIGLTALRFHRGLALFATGLSALSFLLLWLWLEKDPRLVHGDSAAHVASPAVHPYFLADEVIYLFVFGALLVAAAGNARRLVRLRVAEGERAAREGERALMGAGLAHEIRNPLGGVYGAAQLLREEGKADPRFTGLILEETRRLAEVVESFLQHARPYPVRPENTDLSAFAREFCREQARLFPESPLDAGLPSEDLPARTDAGALRQILLNLLRNARRHQVPGVPVRLRLRANGNPARVAEFRIEDDGEGVPPELRGRLFEPFRSAAPGGSGVGLALSRRMARALGGELEYEPLSPGSRFVLRIPLFPEAA